MAVPCTGTMTQVHCTFFNLYYTSTPPLCKFTVHLSGIVLHLCSPAELQKPAHAVFTFVKCLSDCDVTVDSIDTLEAVYQFSYIITLRNNG